MGKLLAIIAILICLNAQATHYYVSSSTGNDNNLGTSTISPWKTIAKINSSWNSFLSGDEISFLKGDIFYGVIIPAKTFSIGNPLRFTSYSMGSSVKPVITGLVNIDSWTAVSGQTNLWEGTSADSSARVALNDCNLVLVNGVNTPMGRYPNADAVSPLKPWLTVQNATSTSLASTTVLPADFTGGDVVTKAFNFMIVRYPITSQQPGQVLVFSKNNYNIPNNGWGFFIENDSIATVLDQQNEWWYSGSRKKLRMYSVGSPASLNIQMATLDTLVYIYPSGSAVRDNLTFDGIDFIGSNRRTFFVADADNVTIKNCTINFCGLYAFWGGTNALGPETAQNLRIDSCTINNVNSQGIVLQNHYVNAYIGHNTIKNTGKYYGMFRVPVYAGTGSNWPGAFGSIVLANATGTTVEYNRIDTSGYNGITYQGSNITIRYNEISHQCYSLQDGAGIYSQGYRDAKTVTAGSFVIGTQYAVASRGTTNWIAAGSAIATPIISGSYQTVFKATTNGSATTPIGTTVASGSGTVATLTFATQTAPPFLVGSQIIVSGVTPAGYNGTKTVTACTASTVSYNSSTTGAQTVAGTITGPGTATTSNGAEYNHCKVYNNIVHDGVGNNSGTNSTTSLLCQGIYMDENTVRTQVYNNTSFQNPSYGIFSNSNSDCSFTGNTMYGNKLGQMLFSSQGRVVTGVPEQERRDTSKNNILVGTTIAATLNPQYAMVFSSRYSTIDSFFTVLDSNIYAHPINDGLSPVKDTVTIFVQLNSFTVFGQYRLAQWKTYANTFTQTNSAGRDQHSNKSPYSITTLSKLSIIYNPTDHDSTVSLTGNFVDMRNVARSGSVVLTPYTSMVLISVGGQITPVINWAPSNYTYGPSTTFAAKMNATTVGNIPGSFKYFNGTTELTSSTVLGANNAIPYSLTVNFTPTDAVTYSTATKTGVPLTVSQLGVILSYTSLTQAYTGSPLAPGVTSSDGGVAASQGVTTTYNPATAHITALIYGVNTSLNANANYTASPISGTFTITKAAATITISDTNQVVGSTHAVTVVTSPPGLSGVTTNYVGASYNSQTPPTAVGNYTVTSTLVDSNYTAPPKTVGLHITSSGATISLVTGDLNQVYSGADKSVRATTVPAGLPYTVAYTSATSMPNGKPRYVGSYQVIATITGGASTPAGTLTITKLNPVITWPVATGDYIIRTTQALAAGSTQQLNATSSVSSGTFVYRKTSNQVQVFVGTVLGVTTNLTVTFTPTNSANINIATKATTITVNSTGN